MMSSDDCRTEACDNASHRQGPGSVILVPPPLLLQHFQFGAVQTSACPQQTKTSQSASLANAKRKLDVSSTSNEGRLHDGHVSPVVDEQRSLRTEKNVTMCSDVNCDNGCADYGYNRCSPCTPAANKRTKTIHWLTPRDPGFLVSTRSNNWYADLIGATPRLSNGLPKNIHFVPPSLNGVNGEWTGDDDRPTVVAGGDAGATRPPKWGGKKVVNANSGVDAGLRQLATVTPDAELRPKKTADEKRRDHKSANSRQHNSRAKTQPVERPHADKPLVPVVDEKKKDDPVAKAPADPAHDGEPAAAAKMTAREKKLAEYRPLIDQVECKIFIRVPEHLLGRSTWPLAWRCILYTLFASCYLVAVDYLFIDHPMFIVSTLLFVALTTYLFYRRVVRPLMHTMHVDTAQWADDQRNPVFGFTELDIGSWWYVHANQFEVNAMLRNGYNAYRYVLYSREVLEFLTRQKHGKPSSFSQQQYASYALREFDHIDPEIVMHTATVHHQNLLVKHYEYLLSQGEVDIGIERM